MPVNWEDTFRQWMRRSSDNEDGKRDRTEDAIKRIIKNDLKLGDYSLRVYAKGSYKNNTNVRLNSDVDIAVELCDQFKYEVAQGLEGLSPAQLNVVPYSGNYVSRNLKNEVEEVLKREFGSRAVTRKNKALEVERDNYLEADVVPCVSYRFYYSRDLYGNSHYHSGIMIFPDSGRNIINYPVQTHERGNEKNNATGRRYKRIVRILKRLENKMVAEGVIEEVPSFLIESLVHNVPNNLFNHLTYTEDVRNVLYHLYENTSVPNRCNDWLEVNRIKYLFHDTQKWTQGQAYMFAMHAWEYIGSK